MRLKVTTRADGYTPAVQVSYSELIAAAAKEAGLTIDRNGVILLDSGSLLSMRVVFEPKAFNVYGTNVMGATHKLCFVNMSGVIFTREEDSIFWTAGSYWLKGNDPKQADTKKHLKKAVRELSDYLKHFTSRCSSVDVNRLAA